ncbi:MAG: hypothetical protein MI919_22805 [Holophagales bacterium]|nr:hypothetical protein [Holophagales bacterium]
MGCDVSSSDPLGSDVSGRAAALVLAAGLLVAGVLGPTRAGAQGAPALDPAGPPGSVVDDPALGALRSVEPPGPLPRLIFQAPEQLEGRREVLERFDPTTLEPILDLVGLRQPGPPIRIVLAPEGSREARRAPSWSVAYALGNAGLVVLIPSRVPVYPDGDLEQVLRHEIAHVLISRAAGRYGVPRWFHEGVAIVGAREWRLEDRSRLVLEAFRRQQVPMSDVELGFSGGAVSAGRAYAVSAAFVRYLLEQWGDDAVARVLEEVAKGKRFRRAFRSALGVSLKEVEAAFWADFDFWNRWVPFLTSSGALWLAVTALALLAFRRRRQRDEELRQRWDEEELDEPGPTPGGWVM